MSVRDHSCIIANSTRLASGGLFLLGFWQCGDEIFDHRFVGPTQPKRLMTLPSAITTAVRSASELTPQLLGPSRLLSCRQSVVLSNCRDC